MAHLAPNEPTLATWEQSLPLREALETFSDDLAVVAEYRELLRYIFQKLPPADLPYAPQLSPQPPLQDDPSTRYLRFLAAEERLQRRIGERISSGELLVLRRAKFGGQPEWVPVSQWHSGRISRDQSELWIETEGFEFRIVESPNARVATIIKGMPATEPKRDRGPASSRHWIAQAYNTLLKNDKIDFNSSFQANIPRIRLIAKSLRGGNQDAKGFGHSSIAAQLSKRFIQDVKARGISKKRSKD